MNFWLEKAYSIYENEVLLAKPGSDDLSRWYILMPNKIPVIYTEKKPIVLSEQDVNNVIGYVYYIRITKYGLEGILRTAKRYHRYHLFLTYHPASYQDPFYVVIHKKW